MYKLHLLAHQQFASSTNISPSATITINANTAFTLSATCTTSSNDPLIYEMDHHHASASTLPNQGKDVLISNGIAASTTYSVKARTASSSFSASKLVQVSINSTSGGILLIRQPARKSPLHGRHR